MSNFVTMRIDSQYLDSYLYSGTLFLSAPNGVISIYDWANVVQETLALHGSSRYANYFLDYRELEGRQSLEGENEFEVTADILERARTDSLEWGVWPTDLTVYSNVLYLSDEAGVHSIPFDYRTGTLNKEDVRAISDGYVYSVTAIEGGRIAAATSMDGLNLIFPTKYKIETRTIIEDEVLDCDWFGTNLVANSRSKAYLAEFQSLPKRDEYSELSEFKADYKRALQRAPRRSSIGVDHASTYAWLAGQDVCTVSPPAITQTTQERRIIKARSASFGSVLEYTSGVELVRAEVSQDVGILRPVFWRVFSRSKNYLNHLHICDKAGLQIRSYEATEASDSYSVELKDLDVR